MFGSSEEASAKLEDLSPSSSSYVKGCGLHFSAKLAVVIVIKWVVGSLK